tara:strand:- start:515 stop:883 length:369 start_codon:yes stop_codon:yes gene_type:complete
MTLAELRDEIRTLIQAGDFSFVNLSADGKSAFSALLTTERGRRFTQEQIGVIREFWFRAAPPTNPQVIAANALLPSDRQITPTQADNGNWYVSLDIITDRATWGTIFSFLKAVKIERGITFG